MGREWKPGDVAIRTDGHDDGWMVSLVVTGEGCPNRQANTHPSRPHWHHADGGWDEFPDDVDYYSVVSTYRPLVVIDPEDREQVERLRASLESMSFSPWACGAETCLTSALRSLIEPPKPEEPTGLGAVVETVCACSRDPRRFVRAITDEFADAPWKSECGHHMWHDFDSAVKVLSEGVTP